MPDGVSACHTAVVGDYLIEGDVPASDIKRLLTEKPKALGLAVPISKSRYIATESQLTISPSKWRAIVSASAVFPLAVGPSTATSSGSRGSNVSACSN